jgi:hypothetical protein
MTKICDSKVKRTSGGYNRIFDDPEIGSLFSAVHSANIRNGNELEELITEYSSLIPNNNLDAFIKNIDTMKTGIYLAPKYIYVKSEVGHINGHQPDFLVFNIQPKHKYTCSIIELKDGNDFDTKKSAAEKLTLTQCQNVLTERLNFEVNYYICCFNATTHKEIISGLKHAFNDNEVCTGKEFCNFLSINYDQIILRRKQDALNNRQELIKQLAQIPWFMDGIKEYTSDN